MTLFSASRVGQKSPVAGRIESQLKSTHEETMKASGRCLSKQNLRINAHAAIKIMKQLRIVCIDKELTRQALIPDPAIMMYMPAMSTDLLRDRLGSLKLPW
tara:strand:- start:1352 stop:1654 length:303 start_codon:yes stop_codon:yes gene_type:complete